MPRMYYDGKDILGCQSQEIYSTQEIRIGTWIDGKPLYRRVINSITASETGTQVNIATIDDNLDTLVSLNGGIYFSSTARFIPINYYNGNDHVSTFIGSNTIRQIVSNSSYCNKSLMIVIKYTKNTDAPSTASMNKNSESIIREDADKNSLDILEAYGSVGEESV